jgi:hypothetical protein
MTDATLYDAIAPPDDAAAPPRAPASRQIAERLRKPAEYCQ